MDDEEQRPVDHYGRIFDVDAPSRGAVAPGTGGAAVGALRRR